MSPDEPTGPDLSGVVADANAVGLNRAVFTITAWVLFPSSCYVPTTGKRATSERLPGLGQCDLDASCKMRQIWRTHISMYFGRQQRESSARWSVPPATTGSGRARSSLRDRAGRGGPSRRLASLLACRAGAWPAGLPGSKQACARVRDRRSRSLATSHSDACSSTTTSCYRLRAGGSHRPGSPVPSVPVPTGSSLRLTCLADL